MTNGQKKHNTLNIEDDTGSERETGNRFDEETRLAKRGVAHAEASTNMLGKQFDGAAIGDRIGLRQVLHGFHQQALAIHVTRVCRAFTAFAPNLGRNRDRKNLGHAIGVSGVYKVPTTKAAQKQYTARLAFYSPIFIFMEGLRLGPDG
jgi:hypothetical protein